jgi:hypothetical protein
VAASRGSRGGTQHTTRAAALLAQQHAAAPAPRRDEWAAEDGADGGADLAALPADLLVAARGALAALEAVLTQHAAGLSVAALAARLRAAGLREDQLEALRPAQQAAAQQQQQQQQPAPLLPLPLPPPPPSRSASSSFAPYDAAAPPAMRLSPLPPSTNPFLLRVAPPPLPLPPAGPQQEPWPPPPPSPLPASHAPLLPPPPPEPHDNPFLSVMPPPPLPSRR